MNLKEDSEVGQWEAGLEGKVTWEQMWNGPLLMTLISEQGWAVATLQNTLHIGNVS